MLSCFRYRSLEQDEVDRIVVVMGPTGVGKSTFIEYATRQDGRTIGHGLRSYTSDIRAVRVNHPMDGRPVVFVDTPGFDDTYMSDMEILAMIAEWLMQTYKSKSNLTAIIYVHSISDSRMTASVLKNLRIFTEMCGQQAMPNVVIVTTKWSKVTIEEGEQREQELKTDFWNDMIAAGCRTARFEDTYDSAWSTIGNLSAKDRAHVQLAHEIVDSNLQLNETQAGITLNKRLIRDRQRALCQLKKQAQNQNNELLDKGQTEEIEEKIRQILHQLDEMKIPFTRKVRLFFSRH